MDKLELFKKINERRQATSSPPLTKEEFIAAMSNLEVRGIIETTSTGECRPGRNIKYYAEVKSK